MRRQTLGLLLLLGGAMADSSSGILTRLTAADGFTTASARGLIAFIFLFGVLLIRDRGRVLTSITGVGLWGLLFVAMNSGGMVLNVLSLKFTAVANFFMIFATAPFLAAIMARVFLKEPLDRPTLLAALAGFAGIAIMVSGGLAAGGTLGNILAVIVVMIYAALVIIVRFAPRIDVLPLICMTVLGSGVLALPMADFSGLALRDWAALTGLGVAQLGLGNLLIFSAVSRVSAAQAGMLGILGAVFAPTWMFVVLGEIPPQATLIGGSVILSAAGLHLIHSLKRGGPVS